MKISAKTPLSSLQRYQRAATETQKKNAPIHESGTPLKNEDRVHLSEKAKELQAAKKKLEEIPDIRMDKVNEIKQKIDDGSYDIDGKAIASNLLKETIENSKIISK